MSSLVVVLGVAAILSAQAIDPDTYKVSYFSNNIPAKDYIPVGTVRVSNVGTSEGDLCADIYVFDPTQELNECCSCLVTPDGLRTLSVATDLTGNTLTGGIVPETGAIKIVSAATTGGTCPAPTAPKPTSGVRAWGTHTQVGGYVTETEFLDSGLSAVELGRLAAECSAIQLVGSGKGVCTCGTGEIVGW
ncbi:MAG: hypothetical protein ABSG13_11500 [Bryobacteraceae bacterium]